MAKVIGVRKAASDYIHVPRGFHVEIWCDKTENGDIEVYTSEYLSQNSWTINMPGKCITASEKFCDDWDRMEGLCLTKKIKKVALELWDEKE